MTRDLCVQPGALRVFFGPGGGGPYNIIKLEGAAAAGYDLALVFSCDASIGSAFLPQVRIFVSWLLLLTSLIYTRGKDAQDRGDRQ